MNLLPHQKEAVKEFLRKNGQMILHADTGTGKTAIGFTAIDAALRGDGTRALWITPAILKSQALEDSAVWTRFRAVMVSGDKNKRRAAWASYADIFIVNPEVLLSDFGTIKAMNPGMIVIDECQRFANPTAKTVRALKKLNPFYRLAMSGTPAPNALHDFWSMVDWVKPGSLRKTWWEFRQAECKMHPRWPQVIGYWHEDRIRKSISEVTHRIRREDCLKLPPLVEKRLECVMRGRQLEAYEKLRKELRIRISEDEELTAVNALALLSGLRQLADEPQVMGIEAESAKSELLSDLLDAISSKKIIIFSQFARVAEILAWRFKGLLISGQVLAKDREEVLQRFKSNDKIRVLVMTTAGAFGINLQEADTVIMYDMPWTAAMEDQQIARAWRMGQTKTVTSYRLIAKGTVDEKMEKIVERKKRLNKKNIMSLLE